MHKTQSLGVKGLARQNLEAVFDELAVFCIDGTLSDFSSIITLVIEKGMTYPVEMHPDLVGSSSLKTTFDNGHISEPLQHLPMSHSPLAVVPFWKDLETHPVRGVPTYVPVSYTHLTLPTILLV